jgi:outer membrane receptor protein involved in Fe transport
MFFPLTHFARACVALVAPLLAAMPRLAVSPPLLASTFCCVAAVASAAQPAEARRSYNLPRGDAATTLHQFAGASGRQIVFMMDKVRGERTNAIAGEFAPREALERMLAGTALVATQDAATGAFVVTRRDAPRRSGEAGPDSPSDKTMLPAKPAPSQSFLARATALLALAVAPAASAQPAAAPKDAPVALSAFEVRGDKDYGYRATNSLTATRTAAPIIETPLNIAVVTEEFFQDIGANFLNDGLKYVSNVSTTTLGNNGRIGGSGDGTKIRGFDIPFALRNGFRRNRNVVIRNIDRVEVAKGPVSMLFGQTAPGGLINYITKKPKFTDAGSATLRFGDYSLWSGEVEAERAYDVFSTPGKDLAVRAMLARSDQDLFRDYEFRDERYALGQLSFRPMTGLNVMLEIEHTDTRSNLAQGLPWGSNQWATDVAAALAAGRTADYNRWVANRGQWQNDIQLRTGVRPPGVDSFMARANPDGKFITYNLTGPDTRFNARSTSLSADLDWKINDHLTVRYGANRYDVYYFEKFLFTDTPSADYTFPAAGFASRNNDHVITSHQADAVLRWDLAGLKNTVVVGAEWINDYETVRRLAFDTALIAQGSGISRATPPGSRPNQGPALNGMFYYDTRVQPPVRLDPGITTFDRPQNKQIVEQDRKGLYVAWRGQLLGDRLNLNLGLRREQGDTSTFAPFTGVRTTDVQKGTTPMGGVNFRVTPGLAVFASYSESFVPSAARSGTGPLVRPEEIVPLGPIEGKGYEAGLKTDLFNNTLSGTISLFRVEQSNEPILDGNRTNNDPRNRDPNSPSNIRFPFDVTFFVGGGARATEGLDADFVWSPQRNFQLLGSFTYTWKAEIEKGLASSPGTGFRADGTSQVLPLISPNGTRLVRVPEYTAALFGKYTFATGDLKGWSVGLGGRYMGEHIVFLGGADFQNFTQSAYTIFDANVGYETKVFNRPVQFTLSATNLADKEYVDGTYTPGPPRRVQLTARFRF